MSTSHDGREVAAAGRSPALPSGGAEETAGSVSAVIPAPAAPHVSGSQLQPAPEVLDGELITEAEYA
ncbi:MAG: hypothetical protein ACRDSO_02380, partial [Pseudonocardiaceae bacterium]